MVRQLRTLLVLLVLCTAGAQLPFVPPEAVDGRRRLSDDSLSLCVWRPSPTAEIDAAVAEAIGQVLLLSVDLHLIDPGKNLTSDEFWRIVYAALLDDCDGFLGVRLTTDVYPDWLTTTRPYYDAKYYLVATDNRPDGFSSFTAGDRIASPVYTEIDESVIIYNSTLASERRWLRLPYEDPLQVAELVQAGSLDAAVVWEPHLSSLFRDENVPASSLVLNPVTPLQRAGDGIGIALLSNNSFTRSMLDSAIEELMADDQLELLIDELLEPLERPE